jgi:hypothetical protein
MIFSANSFYLTIENVTAFLGSRDSLPYLLCTDSLMLEAVTAYYLAVTALHLIRDSLHKQPL